MKRTLLFLTLAALFSGGPAAMTELGGAQDAGFSLPYKIRGELTADFGWETPSISFRQNTLLRLYAKNDVAANVSTEVQLLFEYSNTDNQFSTSLRDSSLLSTAILSAMDSLAGNNVDTSRVNFEELLNFGEVMLNSRMIPKLTLTLDRADIKYRATYADITLGKQVVAWGSGYAWNPTDAINIRNPLDPTEPRKGVGALVVDIPFREWFLFTFAMSPGKIFKESTEGLRLKFMNRWFDAAFSGNIVGGSERMIMNIGQKVMLGFDFNTVLFKSFNVWLESSVGSYNQERLPEIPQTVIGFQRVFFDKFRFLLEFYNNGAGVGYPYNTQEVSKNVAFVTLGDMGGLGTNYIATALIYTINERWEATGVLLRNSQDKSMAISPLVTYQPMQNFKLRFEMGQFFGDARKTEFGSFKNTTQLCFQYLF